MRAGPQQGRRSGTPILKAHWQGNVQRGEVHHGTRLELASEGAQSNAVLGVDPEGKVRQQTAQRVQLQTEVAAVEEDRPLAALQVDEADKVLREEVQVRKGDVGDEEQAGVFY